MTRIAVELEQISKETRQIMLDFHSDLLAYPKIPYIIYMGDRKNYPCHKAILAFQVPAGQQTQLAKTNKYHIEDWRNMHISFTVNISNTLSHSPAFCFNVTKGHAVSQAKVFYYTDPLVTFWLHLPQETNNTVSFTFTKQKKCTEFLSSFRINKWCPVIS